MEQSWPIYAFDAGAGKVQKQQLAADSKLLLDKRKPLYCFHCFQLICFKSEAIEMAGRHEHVFTNPAKMTFRIACYEQAAGCYSVGTPTCEYTWFQGYQWQIAVCIGCGEHLGWMFTGPDTFFGLICNRLVDESSA